MDASTIIAIISLFVSIIAIVVSALASAKANSISEKSLGVSYANIELEMRKSLSEASGRISDLHIKMSPLIQKAQTNSITPTERAELGAYEKNFEQAIQEYLNAYEGLCAQYIDGKIDKIRFKKSFHVEIRNLVQRDNLKKYFDVASHYRAILKVYNEWENLET